MHQSLSRNGNVLDLRGDPIVQWPMGDYSSIRRNLLSFILTYSINKHEYINTKRIVLDIEEFCDIPDSELLELKTSIGFFLKELAMNGTLVLISRDPDRRKYRVDRRMIE